MAITTPIRIITGTDDSSPSMPVRIANWNDFVTAIINEIESGSLSLDSLTVDYVQFNTGATEPAHSTGLVRWDADDRTVSIDLQGDTVTDQVGQENHLYARNATGAQINNGQIVYVSGAQGNRPQITLARADVAITACTCAIATEDIPNNSDGYCTTFGIVRQVNTAGMVAGQQLYLSAVAAGAFANTVPSSPNNFTVPVGVVLRVNPAQGMILFYPRGLSAFGDVQGGNYTQFESDGTMIAVGNAACWKDINFDPIIGRGGSAPDLVNLDTTSIQVVAFDGNVTLEQISNTKELQHDYLEGTDLKFHVHWAATTAAAGNVEWFIQYYIYGDATLKASGTISAVAATPSVAWRDVFTQIGTVADNSFEIGDQISLRLYRDPNGVSGNDTYGADAIVKTVGIHYQVDTLGSRTEAAK